jgi:osmotically-inducible protein OsmY
MKRATDIAKLIVGATMGAALAYAFDPDRGRARRARLKSQASAQVRRDRRALERRAHYERQKLTGVRHKLTARHRYAPASDQVLVDRVRSEVFGYMPGIAHHVNLDVVDGVATLRGEHDGHDEIERLATAVGEVAGVVRVINLVHLPGERPANKMDALRISG